MLLTRRQTTAWIASLLLVLGLTLLGAHHHEDEVSPGMCVVCAFDGQVDHLSVAASELTVSFLSSHHSHQTVRGQESPARTGLYHSRAPPV